MTVVWIVIENWSDAGDHLKVFADGWMWCMKKKKKIKDHFKICGRLI